MCPWNLRKVKLKLIKKDKTIPGLHLSRREKKNRKKKAKRAEEKKLEESNKINETSNSVDELLKESNKITQVLNLARLQHESLMEETWGGKIPIECSTPKMQSSIGIEIQNEIRRNSISISSGFKRKNSPEDPDAKNQRIKLNRSYSSPCNLNTNHTTEDHNHYMQKKKTP